jgi:hypothetical protein
MSLRRTVPSVGATLPRLNEKEAGREVDQRASRRLVVPIISRMFSPHRTASPLLAP